MDTKRGKARWGGDGVVLNWAIGIDMYTDVMYFIHMYTDVYKIDD